MESKPMYNNTDCNCINDENVTFDVINGQRNSSTNGEHAHSNNNRDQEDHNCFKFRKNFQVFLQIFQVKYNQLPSDPTLFQRFRYLWLCPPHGYIGIFATKIIIYGLLLGATVTLLNTDFVAPFALNCLAIVILAIICTIAGSLTQCIKLPALLGMLIAGCLMRNLPVVRQNVGERLNSYWCAAIRTVALSVILVQAGLGLDPAALRKLSCVVVRLAFIPCIVECTVVAIASNLLLHLPWQWAFMLGFILSAVSPAVVVPTLLALQARGFGVDQGIPTLVIAASSIDDVLAITGFGVVLGITFSTGHIAWNLFKGPLEAIVGLIVGVFCGLVLWYIPPKDMKQADIYRSTILVCGALVMIFGSQVINFPGSGPLSALSMAFVASYRWRQEGCLHEQAVINKLVSFLWLILEPLLFGLIGAEVDLTIVQPTVIGLGVAVLLIGLVCRITASFLAVCGVGLMNKEKFFISLAWLPKATVQAAIGSVALSFAKRHHPDNHEMLDLGTQLVTLAVLSIIITAPLGAVAITLSGPRILRPSVSAQENTNDSHGDEC